MTTPIGIEFARALQIVRHVGGTRRTQSQPVNLRSARSAVLSESIVAPISLPTFANSAMDGFACRSADMALAQSSGLALIGSQYAGRSEQFRIASGECVRITTGAPLPDGADCVAIKENAEVSANRVRLMAAVAAGTHLRLPGEDCRAGEPLFDAGTTLGSAALGLLAALGFERVGVACRPSVAVFTSGDELRPPGTMLQPGEIYDSNRVLLQSLLAEEGIDTLAWPALPDDAERMRSALHDAVQAYDLVVTCGGVSAGEKDLLPALIEREGRIHFWKVRMRPGMPVLFGEWGRALVLALPGNPVSVLATFRTLGRPLLDAMQGRRDRAPALRARLLEPVRKSHDRLEFRRALLSCSSEATLVARAHPADGSHQQRGAAQSNALMILPESARQLDAGSLVDIEPYGPIVAG
jgi:molybdopterin molybdotransferase